MMLPPKYTKIYKRKYLGWLQAETRKLHKISEDKNLTESVHNHAKMLVVAFLLWFSFLHLWLAWHPIAKLGKGLWSAPKLRFFMYLSFNLHCLGFELPKTPKLSKNWLVTLSRFLNVPIELKGINYYSKVFKTVSFKV